MLNKWAVGVDEIRCTIMTQVVIGIRFLLNVCKVGPYWYKEARVTEE